jgi:hypothetical protein
MEQVTDDAGKIVVSFFAMFFNIVLIKIFH